MIEDMPIPIRAIDVDRQDFFAGQPTYKIEVVNCGVSDKVRFGRGRATWFGR